MDTNDFLDQMDPEEKTARPHESEFQPDLSETEIEVETGPSTPKHKQRSSFSLNPRSWSLAVRFSLVIFLMAVISLSGLSWYTSSTSEQDMITEVGKNFQLQAETLNELTVSFFREKVTQLQALASMDAVTTLTRGKNASYVGNLDEIQDRIAELDELWINAPEGDTFVDSIISPSSWVNALTYQLLDFRESFPENAEIFITDRYGANISATDRTSDYYQADEGWWQASWNGGQGAIYISQPEFDESAGVTGVQISVPIMNSSNTEAIGVVRSTVVLDELFALLDRSFFGETGHSILFDNTGLVIYEPGEMAAEESSDLLAAGVREHFTNSPSHYMTAVDQHGEDALFGHTLLFAAPPSEGSLEGTKYQLESWISNAINDLGWAVVVRQATYESLAAVSQLGYNIGYVNIAIIVLASLMGGYFARSLTQPLTKLSETAEKLGQGNLDARVDIPSDDEVGLVARTINQMADQIQSTLDGLEETISDRTKELRERANEVEASQRVTFAASERTSPEDFLDLLVNLINDQFDVYHTQVYMLDADRQNAVLRESTGYAGRQLLQRGHTLALHKPSLVATSIKENRSVLVPDVTKDPNWASNPLLPLTQSELVVPLRVGDEVIGAIDIQDRVPDRFRQDSVAVFEAMTEHVAFLFENNELLEQITQQSMELETFTNQLRSAADLAEQLSTIRDPEKLLAEAVEQIQLRFGLYHAHIYLLDENRENLVMSAGSGEVGRVLKESGHTIPMNAEVSLVARAARTRGSVLVEDTSKEADFFPNPLLPQTSSEVSIPLMAGEKLLGVLDVQDDAAGRFGQTDVDTLVTLGGQVASALDNASLFQEMESTTAEFRSITESSSDAIITAGEDGNIRFWNKSAELMFGYTENEVIGQSITLIMPEKFREGHHTGITRVNSGGEKRVIGKTVELIGRKKNGDQFPIDISLSTWSSPDGNFYSAVIRDISERKKAEGSLIQSDRLKSEFLANMSHELRTPLNSIIGYTDVLLEGIDGELEPEIMVDVQAIHENSQNLLRIINDILDLAKIEAGRMILELSHVDIPSMLEEVKVGAAGLLVNSNIDFKTFSAPGTTSMEVDATRLKQILNNLVSNAVKFTHDGEINLRARTDGDFVVFEVQDSGSGISEKDLEKVFEEFQQADTSTSRAAEGTGLGLTITRRLVQMHSGTIDVRSQLGEGSTFIVRLPIEAQVPANITVVRSTAEAVEGNGAPKSPSAAKRVTGMLKEAIGINNGNSAAEDDEEKLD